MTYARRLVVAAAFGFVATAAVWRWVTGGVDQALHLPGATVRHAIDELAGDWADWG